MAAKGVLRTVKNYTMGYSPIQMKVRSATSNTDGGPTMAAMSEIAQATYNQTDFLGIMEVIDKRMDDKGRLWRHVHKALILLDFLLHSGSPYVVEYAVDNLYTVKTLREFQFIDESGLDQGANVREKAKAMTSLLMDRSRLDAERKNRNRGYSRPGHGDSALNHYNGQHASSSSRIPYNSARNGSQTSHRRTGSLATSRRGDDEDSDVRRAVAESKRTSGPKRVPDGYNEEAALRRAIEESSREAKEKVDRSKPVEIGTSTGEADLLGGFDDEPSTALVTATATNAGAGNLGMVNNGSAMSFSHQQHQQQQQFSSSSATGDLLGAFGSGQAGTNNQFMAMSSMTTSTTMNSTNMAGMGGMSNNMGGMSGMGNNMGGMGSMGNMGTMGGVNTGAGAATFDPFGLSNTPAAGSNMGSAMGLVSGMNSMNMGSGVGAGLSAPLGFSTPLAANTPGAYDNSGFGGASSNQYMAKSSMTASVTESSLGGANPFGLGATQQQQQQPSPMANTGGFGGAAGMFGSAFDGGAGAKALPYAGVNDANARLAEIARNSDKIDPFASLAMQSSSNPFGASSATSSAMQSQGLEASSALTSMVNTPANFTTGGSSLLDFGGISQTSSAIMPSPQSFGQVNRNPFAAGGSGMALGQSSMQPSLNQLMAGGGGSGAGSSNQLSMSTSNNLFDQQQNNSSTGAFSNVHAESQNMSFQQQQQQQGGGMGGFSNIQAESQNKSFQQSQGAGAGGAFSSLQAESQQSSYQQSQGFGQPQGLGQLQGFGQSQGLGQSQGFGQPQGLGQMQGFGQQSQPQQQQQNPFAQDSFAGSSQPNFFGL